MNYSEYPDPFPFDDSDDEDAEPRTGFRDLLRDFLSTIIQALIFAFFIIYFIAQASVVHGYSMEPNLHSDQRVIIDKVSYRFDQPDRGDVVVVDVPDSEIPLIKRVVGLAGETVEIRDNQVFIDGQPLDEPYLTAVHQQNYGPTKVPEGELFVMGDNRSVSRDSRTFGPVSVDQILGRAWISYWPMENVGLVR